MKVEEILTLKEALEAEADAAAREKLRRELEACVREKCERLLEKCLVHGVARLVKSIGFLPKLEDGVIQNAYAKLFARMATNPKESVEKIRVLHELTAVAPAVEEREVLRFYELLLEKELVSYVEILRGVTGVALSEELAKKLENAKKAQEVKIREFLSRCP
ncbi:MAG TPA: hypothetical protein ENF26_05305 [Methanomicrobia archaeon]|nr:hypothetical protein [Methanomicrobia archaeon]HEX59544.1 hypothetical protein [Methanomicrobia archaeon]